MLRNVMVQKGNKWTAPGTIHSDNTHKIETYWHPTKDSQDQRQAVASQKLSRFWDRIHPLFC